MGTILDSSYDAVVIGGGIAGLTAAALLSQAGARVALLERHTIAGGCASFYQRDRFRFDVGATLVGGFGRRGAHTAVFKTLGIDLGAQRIEPAMVVHLPDALIARYGDERWKSERIRAFGDGSEPFWIAQEHLASAAWSFAAHLPALPVDPVSALCVARAFGPDQWRLLPAFGKTVAHLYPPGAGRRLRAFVDAQLIITAQAAAGEVDLTYGATALDLAREGTYHVSGGIGAIATALARSVRRNGGTIAYGSPALAIETRNGRVAGVHIEGREFRTRRAISALPVLETVRLCDDGALANLKRKAAGFPQRWGAFTVYCGVPEGVVPVELPLHHQLVGSYDEPLGEGNSTFVSFSAPGERGRAPGDGRAITVSTHTDVARWERAARDGSLTELRAGYERRLLQALERVVPGATSRAAVIENATPLTFARYTGRSRGLVGGLPQTRGAAALGALSHRTPVRGLFLCGDTVFPGQSTVGATLSGNAAARAALAE